MRAAAVPVLLVFAVTAQLAHPAGAQAPGPLLQPLERTLPARAVDVTVSYNLMMPMKSSELEDQKEALKEGRRAIYEIASNECGNLIATIASTCQLTRLNVQSNVQRGNPPREATFVNASASYQIQLKSADGGR